MKESEQFTLAQFAAEFRNVDERFNHCCAKLFSIVVPSIDDFISFIRDLKITKESVPNRHPVNLVVGDFSGLVNVQGEFVPCVNGGNLNLNFVLSKRSLPACMYLAIFSAALKTGGATDYTGAHGAINFVRALLGLSFGRMASYTWIADFEFDSGGTPSFPSEVFRRPLYADHARFSDALIINEIVDRLALQQPEFRLRFQRACNFFSNALNQKDEAFRFSSYWIALEILAGGKSGAIKARLAAAYGQPKIAFVEGELHFKEIENVRHNLIHKGIFATMPSYHERLLQLYFWDIAILQIGLPCRGLARALIFSGVIDEERKSTKVTSQ